MSEDPVVQAPARLIDEPTEVAELLTHSEAQFRHDLDEGQAWKRLKPCLDAAAPPSKRRGLLLIVLAAMGVALAVGWYAGVHYSAIVSKNRRANGGASAAVTAGHVLQTDHSERPLSR